MPTRVAPTRSANRSILANPLPSFEAVIESTSSQFVDRAASQRGLVRVDADDACHHHLLVKMRHDAGHRSDNNPLSSTRLYQARIDGPEIGGGRLRSKPAAQKSLDTKSMSHPAGPGSPSHHKRGSRARLMTRNRVKPPPAAAVVTAGGLRPSSPRGGGLQSPISHGGKGAVQLSRQSPSPGGYHIVSCGEAPTIMSSERRSYRSLAGPLSMTTALSTDASPAAAVTPISNAAPVMSSIVPEDRSPRILLSATASSAFRTPAHTKAPNSSELGHGHRRLQSFALLSDLK
jgi:hypothetical protein